MKVENVARVRLAPRRAPQEQRELAVCHRLFGEVVVYDDDVLAFVHKILADGRARKRREILQSRRRGSRRVDDDGIFERALLAQLFNDARGLRFLLPDRDVYANRPPLFRRVALADDGVYRDGGLPGAAVADDELALAAPDRDHRVDRLDAGLHGLRDGAPVDDAARLPLDRHERRFLERALSVQRLAQGVDDAPQKLLARRHREHAAG